MQAKTLLTQLSISTAVIVIFLFLQNGYEKSLRTSQEFLQQQFNQLQDTIDSNNKG